MTVALRSFVLTATMVLFASASQAQIVLTEDFEVPDTGNFTTFNIGSTIVTATNAWQVTATGVDLFEDAARPEAVAYDGGQAVDLAGSPGAGVIETTFSTIPGRNYELVFHYARNNLLGVVVGMAEVDVLGSGTLLHGAIQHDPGAMPFNQHVEFRDTFTADGTQATLRFTSINTGNTGITIDVISVEQLPYVPAGRPATWILASLLIGAVGLFALRHQARRAA